MNELFLELADKVLDKNVLKTYSTLNIPDEFCEAYTEEIVKECFDVAMIEFYTAPKGDYNPQVLISSMKRRLGLKVKE